MKKYLSGLWFVLFLCLPNISFSQQWIQDIESQHIGTRDLDASGNMSLQGSMRRVPDMVSYANLSASNTISPYGKSFIVINGTGTITMASTPTISIHAAVNGQEIIITGGSNAVDFVDEGTLTGSLLELGSSSRTLSTGDILELIYYSGKWYEVGFTDN